MALVQCMLTPASLICRYNAKGFEHDSPHTACRCACKAWLCAHAAAADRAESHTGMHAPCMLTQMAGIPCRWLVLAERQRLDGLIEKLLESARAQSAPAFANWLAGGSLDADLKLLSPGLMWQLVKAGSTPAEEAIKKAPSPPSTTLRDLAVQQPILSNPAAVSQL